TRGRLVKGDHMLRYEKFTGTVGESDIAGTLQFELGGKRAYMHGAVESKLLNLADLGPLVGTDQPKEEGILPDMPFDSDRWDSIDADVNGKVGIFLDGGKISRFMMELVAMDIWGVARVKLKGDDSVDIRCAIADFGVKDGMMTTNAFVFDTQVVNVEGTGSVNLKSEEMDVTLNPHPKDRSVASLNSPLYIRGTFGAPKVAPDWKQIGTRGIGAVAMGILSPFLAVLPLMQEGKKDKDSPCQELIAEATKSAREAKADAKAGKPRPPATVSKKDEEKAAAGRSAPPIS